MPVQHKAAFNFGARMVQNRLRYRKMKTALSQILQSAEIPQQEKAAYPAALAFIMRVQHFALQSEAKKASGGALRRLETRLKTLGRPQPPPDDGPIEEADIFKDRKFMALRAWADRGNVSRPPMTTGYAAHIIQTRRRATLESRAYRWLKICVSKLQAVWRGKAWRRKMLSQEVAAKLLQAFMKERRALTRKSWPFGNGHGGTAGKARSPVQRAVEKKGQSLALKHSESIKFKSTVFEL